MDESIAINDWPVPSLGVRIEPNTIFSDTTVYPQQIALKTKKPYVINTFHVECVCGEWSKEKSAYGVRVYFASGNNLWFGGEVAKGILKAVGGDKLVEKFDERVKAGPPTV